MGILTINPSLKQETRCASEETPNRRGHSPRSERGAPLLKARATRKIDLAKPQQVDCHLFEARVNKSYSEVYSEEHWKRMQFQKDLAFFPEEREVVTVFNDGNSLVRNGLSIAGAFLSIIPRIASVFARCSSALGGVLGIPLGLSLIRDNLIKGKAALDYSDTKGAAHSILWTSSGALYTGLSAIQGTSGIMSLAGAAIPAVLTPISAGLGIAMSAGILASSGFGLYETIQFKNAMKKAQDSGGEQGVLKFLAKSLIPKEGKVEKELAIAFQKKWNSLERKVGVACANEIRKTLPELLKNFDSEKAKHLILAIEKANFKQRVKHILLCIIGIISIAAFISLFFALGHFTPILFAIGALLWLAVDSSTLHEFIGEKCWAWHSKGKVEAQTCQTPIAS